MTGKLVKVNVKMSALENFDQWVTSKSSKHYSPLNPNSEKSHLEYQILLQEK